jgi:hypothetical protein
MLKTDKSKVTRETIMNNAGEREKKLYRTMLLTIPILAQEEH